MTRAASAMVLVLWAAAGAGGSTLPEFPFLCTAGEATLQVPPDIGTVSCRITHTEADSEKGLAALREKSKGMVALMKEFSIAPEDSKASDIQKHEVYEGGDLTHEPKLVGYGFWREFTFQFRDLDLCRKVAQRLLQIDYVSDVKTVFDVTGRKAKEEELMQQAIAHARQRAEAIAKGGGAKVVSVYALSEVELRALDSCFLSPSLQTYGPTASGRGRADDQATGLAQADAVLDTISKPSPITLRASIRVLYKIEPQEQLQAK